MFPFGKCHAESGENKKVKPSDDDFTRMITDMTERAAVSSVHDFVERYHDKVAFVHLRMRYHKSWFVDMGVVVEEDVDVDNTVVVDAVHGFLLPSHVGLYRLRHLQHLPRGEVGQHADASVHELVAARESPRLSFDKS